MLSSACGILYWLFELRVYYQHNPSHLSACPMTIHALLHITDSIQANGLVWCYWAFPMEHYCRQLQPAIWSRRFPYASIDWYMVEDAQLTQIKVVHDLYQELSFWGPHSTVSGTFNSIDCELFWSKTHFQLPTFFGADPTCILMPPCHSVALSSKLTTSIAVALVMWFTIDGQVVNIAKVRQYLHSHAIIKEWGKVHCIDSGEGDTMNSSMMVAVHQEIVEALVFPVRSYHVVDPWDHVVNS